MILRCGLSQSGYACKKSPNRYDPQSPPHKVCKEKEENSKKYKKFIVFCIRLSHTNHTPVFFVHVVSDASSFIL